MPNLERKREELWKPTREPGDERRQTRQSQKQMEDKENQRDRKDEIKKWRRETQDQKTRTQRAITESEHVILLEPTTDALKRTEYLE